MRETSVPLSASRMALSFSTSMKSAFVFRLSSFVSVLLSLAAVFGSMGPPQETKEELSDSREVSASSRVDLQGIALVDEERHVEREAGLQRRRLHRAGHGVAPRARIALGDAQLDRVGQ